MRHRVSGKKLNRSSKHRKALRKNLVADLICREQVITTEAKARMLRPATERMITLAKRGLQNGTELHARRLAASRLPHYRTLENAAGQVEKMDVVRKLFNDVAPRYENRPGGYTRIVKLGKRPGDNADMAIIMLISDETKAAD